MRLNAAPTADVTVAISSDNADVTVNKSSLTFTTVNYATNQRVDVTAAEDADAADDTANLTHRPSGGGYGSGQNKDFMVTVTDDDTAGLMLSTPTLGVDEAGQNTYTVKLQTEPTTTVTVTVSSDDTGAATATVSGSTLIFTASNWDTEQTVTVEGVDDGDSANETVTVTNTASGGEYEGVTASVRVTVDDDDKPGITFTPASLTVGEAGVGTYGVRLNAAPTADVTVAISSRQRGRDGEQEQPDLHHGQLRHEPAGRRHRRRGRRRSGRHGESDAPPQRRRLRLGPEQGLHGHRYRRRHCRPGCSRPRSLGVDEGWPEHLHREAADPAHHHRDRHRQLGRHGRGDGELLPPSGSPRRTGIRSRRSPSRGVNDGDSANETVTVTNTASGGEYEGVTASVRFTVDDDDKPGITFTSASLTVGEAGVGTYGVRLNAAPTADVTVAISSDNADVTVNKSSLTFTTVNYATNQRVDVTAAEDADAADDTANLTHRPSGGDYSARARSQGPHRHRHRRRHCPPGALGLVPGRG